MLDLLEVGGKCAVIIPEGVLFGSTEAHTRLRRELLTEHTVEAVVSLPGGAFQSYTGVKTPIVVFQKDTPKADKAADRVWFRRKNRELSGFGFMRSQTRLILLMRNGVSAKGKIMTFGIMLAKFKTRESDDDEVLDYYQPEYCTRRWRLVDDNTLKVFPENKSVSQKKGEAAAIQELFAELPEEPEAALESIDSDMWPRLMQLIEASMMSELVAAGVDLKPIGQKQRPRRNGELKASQGVFKRALRLIIQAKEQILYFEDADSIGSVAFKTACKQVQESVFEALFNDNDLDKRDYDQLDETEVVSQLEAIREYAKLDGYNVMLRTIETFKREEKLKESKSWWADVRVYARDAE